MRKAQKKQMEDFIKLLDQAHDEIKKAIEINKIDLALDLLEQCQEGAIKLGELIESIEGQNVETIPILENYCELTYQIHEEVKLSQLTVAKKAYKNLRKLLIKIEASIKNDITVHKEVVFLPYKASMWDSFESVWKAAVEDSSCDVYVIPIPYYDKNPNGSFRELHYEGEQFPSYVPITHYNSYEFEERHPDIIFIHNPYDEYNFVTSVHPFFFSRNLKRYTDQLIYIPYFVLEEIDPNDVEKVKSMKHFCTVPGVLNSDKTVVQSEDMRQIYINVLTEYTGENTSKVWEEKIVGLGSPKIDKVLSTRREDIKIPEDWRKILQKPDGSFKKTILYNISVGALLQHDEKMLEKIQNVFQLFKENQSDVALLWRAHPLIKATIESMKPQLWKGYEKLVQEYRSDGWGIYDDSPDLDRAIIISDGYYGDRSSLVHLYKQINKPILIQEIDI